MRHFALLLLLYAAMDFGNPLMPGAVSFQAGSIEVVPGTAMAERRDQPTRPASLPVQFSVWVAVPMGPSLARPASLLSGPLEPKLRVVRRAPAQDPRRSRRRKTTSSLSNRSRLLRGIAAAREPFPTQGASRCGLEGRYGSPSRWPCGGALSLILGFRIVRVERWGGVRRGGDHGQGRPVPTDPKAGAFCQIALDSGEKVLVSHDKGGFKGGRLSIATLKWLGLASGETLFELDLDTPKGGDPRSPHGRGAGG